MTKKINTVIYKIDNAKNEWCLDIEEGKIIYRYLCTSPADKTIKEIDEGQADLDLSELATTTLVKYNGDIFSFYKKFKKK
jgi:hypothetical protein